MPSWWASTRTWRRSTASPRWQSTTAAPGFGTAYMGLPNTCANNSELHDIIGAALFLADSPLVDARAGLGATPAGAAHQGAPVRAQPHRAAGRLDRAHAHHRVRGRRGGAGGAGHRAAPPAARRGTHAEFHLFPQTVDSGDTAESFQAICQLTADFLVTQ
jgi:hypothetical protein